MYKHALEKRSYSAAIYGSINFYITWISLLHSKYFFVERFLFFLPFSFFLFLPFPSSLACSWNYTFQNTYISLNRRFQPLNRWACPGKNTRCKNIRPAANPWNDRFSVEKKKKKKRRGEGVNFVQNFDPIITWISRIGRREFCLAR